jgi:hypothetical protein
MKLPIQVRSTTIVLRKWTQPSSHSSLTRGKMGAVERATHTHCPNEGRGCDGHHDSGDRCGEEGVPVARGGCARARGVPPTRQARSVVTHSGVSAALCDRDGGVREYAALGTGVRAARASVIKLMNPKYAKACVKTNRHDGRDAEAICEAVSRPTMRCVSIKMVE